MTLYLTRYCACTQQTYTGQKRPMFCGCGNRYQTESELNPKPRKQLAKVSPKRKAQGKTGGFSASKAQREKVKGAVCVACGREATEDGTVVIDPAHVWPQGKGGCMDPDCVFGLCRGFDYSCHTLFDEGKLSLLERVSEHPEAFATEIAHPLLCHGVTLVELVRRLAGNAEEMVWVPRSSPPSIREVA